MCPELKIFNFATFYHSIYDLSIFYYTKEGYAYNGIIDSLGNIINEDSIFNNDTKLNVSYSKIRITSIALNNNDLEFINDIPKTLEIKSYEPQTAILEGEEFIFTSDNTEVATVDSYGKVIPIGNGKCNIICTLKSDPKVQAVCNVNVHFGIILGDLDRNEAVNANDAAVALDLYKYGNITEKDIEIGDMNEDGVINANDAALILDIYKYGY